MKSVNNIPSRDTLLQPHANEQKTFIEFSLWAPLANEVKLNVKKPGLQVFTQKMDFCEETGVWNTKIEYSKVLFYSYSVTNPTKNGEITKNCLDPYAISMAAYKNDGTSGIAAFIDLEDKASLPYTLNELQNILSKETFEYLQQNQCKVNNCKEKTVIYEISVRDATISKENSDSGTYLKFIEKMPYIKELGITHIQLMPVLNFYNNDETNKTFEDNGTVQGNNYNWGYDPHNYFSPEGWFSSDPNNPFARIKELRTLISVAHSIGLSVTLDVVYNHMAKIDFLDDIVNNYYFRKNDDGTYKNGSFCGNDTNTEQPMMRRLIQDSLIYWTKYYDVDGFRFDLMGLIDSKTLVDGYEMCKKIKPSTLFIGEGWKNYTGSKETVGLDQNFMTQTDDIAVFNDEFRDLCKAGGFAEQQKAFLTNGNIDINQLFYNCIGFPQKNYTADNPLDSVLYFDCHDGLTLHDSICLNANLCDDDTTKRTELLARLKLANALLLTSQGLPFIHAGQEFGRTKKAFSSSYTNNNEVIGPFVKNSYDSSDSINQLHFEKTITQDNFSIELIEYTKGLIDLRKNIHVFTLAGNTASQTETETASHTASEKMSQTASHTASEKMSQTASQRTCKDLILESIKKIETNSNQVLAYTINYNEEKWICCFNASFDFFDLHIEADAIDIFVDSQNASSTIIGTMILNNESKIKVPPLSAFVCKIVELC